MTNRIHPPDDLRDDDIRALFDAQSPTLSPADLDTQIRSAAADAVMNSNSGVKPVAKPQYSGSSRSARYGSWLAVAAVVVLVVGLVPLLQHSENDLYAPPADVPLPVAQSQESAEQTADVAAEPQDTVTSYAGIELARKKLELDSSRIQQPAVKSPTGQAVEASSATDSLAEERTRGIQQAATVAGEAPIAGSPAKESQSVTPLPPVAPDLAEQEFRRFAPEDEAGSSLNFPRGVDAELPVAELQAIKSMSEADIRATFSDHQYRSTLDAWRAEIVRLIQENQQQQVVREWRMFERMHPGTPIEMRHGDR